MKVIIFGDSNTWGYDPRTGLQQPDCFVHVLRSLHPAWTIEAWGLNGRLMYSPQPALRQISGASVLPRLIGQNPACDLLVIALGANDARRMFHQTLYGWLEAFDVLLQTVCRIRQDGMKAPVLFLVPFPVPKKLEASETVQLSLGDSGVEILKTCGPAMIQRIHEAGCLVLDPRKAGIEGGDADGIHLDRNGHIRLAHLLSDWIEKAFSPKP